MGRKIGDRRSFVIDICSTGDSKPGRYVATSPFGAARKAALKVFKAFPNATESRFVLREITRSTLSTNQRHYYLARKTTEDPPRVVNKSIKDAVTGDIKPFQYTVSVRVDIKSIPESEVADLIKMSPPPSPQAIAAEAAAENAVLASAQAPAPPPPVAVG